MKKIVVSFMSIFVLAGLTACGSNNTGTIESTGTQQSQTAQSEQTPTEVEITDSNGTVTVPYAPEKVVVFDNSALDTMDALGVGDRIVAAATSNLPDYLSAYADVESAGGIKEPDLEKINQLQPDLIIISGRQRDFQEELSAIAPTVFLSVDNSDTWASIEANITTIGQIFGKEEEAQEQLASLQGQIDTLKEQAQNADEKALVVMVNEGNLSAFGPGSRYSILYDTFGFPVVDEELEASTHGQSISYEYLLEKNPDIIFVIDRTKAIGGNESESEFVANEIVQETNAGQNDQVIELDAAVWYLAGAGLESIQLMMDDVKPAVE
ncbi:siderophore ABC transporter substrate-binding protein [Enterococcus casseliflavus]|uniref:siderophore ABC transporter substrate-binding protein n=1 Tax=Enterococcus casseliflavus TaxID=37734 RepID=UPI0039A51789